MAFHFSREAYERRVEWFTRARFGMFIHFGLYSIPARGEWVRSEEFIPNEDYDPLIHEFNPTRCDMRQWMRAVRDTGAQYVVLTAKHHDGFCLFDSAYTDFKSTNSPCRGDHLAGVRAPGGPVFLHHRLAASGFPPLRRPAAPYAE